MEAEDLDDSVAVATLDVGLDLSTGASHVGRINGVQVASPVVHVDHRGRVFEIFPGRICPGFG